MRALTILAAAIAAASAQTPGPLSFQCTEEDLQGMRQSCSAAEPCPVYLELSALDVVGPKLFVSGNLHSENSTLASVILLSTDGGKTWTEPYKRIRNAALDQIQFVDFETGWIAGQLLLGTPKDPFLLATQDGGKTWRELPLFEENRPGAIEQFWFDSKNNGTLLIDRVQASETGARHELYETMTGGTSWTLREATAAPIKFKRTAGSAMNTGWRLRPDAASKSYRVEHQEGNQWSTMATFPVRIGECKAQETTLAEPEPEKDEPEQPKPDEPKAAPRKPPTLKKKK